MPDRDQTRPWDMRRELRGFDPGRLAVARKAARLSKSELARLSGVSVSAYHQWESGRSSPSVDALARCAAQLDLEMTDLVVIAVDATYLGDLRVFRGLLQADLGRKLGISTQLVGSLERGQSTLSPDMAQRWSDALNFPLAVVAAAYDRSRTRPAHRTP